MTISLRSRLIISFLAVILICGLVATLVGTHLIGTGVIKQAQDKVRHDLNSGWEVYREEMERLKHVTRFTALRFFIKDSISNRDVETLTKELEKIRIAESLDILTLTDENGTVLVRSRNPAVKGDSHIHDELVNKVLSSKKILSGTVIVPREELFKEGTGLAEQAYMRIIPTPKAKPNSHTEQTSAMCIKAAAPVFSQNGNFLGVLHSGTLLNQNYTIVDRVKEIAYKGVKYKGKEIGTSTIFQGDLRISTNVMKNDGNRAIGTQLSEEVYEQVLIKGLPWIQRAFVVNDWYITTYEPIKDPTGKIIGVFSVGLLEDKYTDIRKSTVAIFIGITLAGMALAFIISNLLAKRFLHPIKNLVSASEHWAKDDLEYQLEITGKDEMAELANNFNQMASELKKRKEKFKELSNKQIMKSDRLATIGQLAAGVAHEINNPLGTISLYAQMVLDEFGAEHEELRENLDIVMKQTNRAGQIVKGLLEFARQSESEMKMLNINDVLNKAIAITIHPAELQNVELTANLASELPHILGDSDKLQQVFINILVNALHAMPNGGELTVMSRTTYENDKCIEIEISDTGYGIPQEHLSKLFDPFFTTKTIGEGTGLGLSISHGIIQNHNGTIDIKSKLGEGSTFIIRLKVGDR